MKINKLIINSVLFPILLTPSLTSCSYKEQNLKLDFHNIQEKMNETIKANIEKFNLYTNHDRKIIFNQDNTPK